MDMDLDLLEIHKLKSEEKFDDFQSEDPLLNVFLENLSQENQNLGLGVTYLANYEGKLVGYFTLSSSSITVRRVQSEDRVKGAENMEYYPATLIGRLAVDKRMENKGIGTHLLQIIYGIIVKVRAYQGVRFLLLNATSKSTSWWRKRGFTPLKDQTGREQPFLYLDIIKMESQPG